MESSFIPNSIPASGRISTPWSARLRKPNECVRGLLWRAVVLDAGGSAPIPRALISIRRWTPCSRKLSAFGVRSSAFFPQSAIRNPQSKIRRVKGAWWPSRSSKPLLIPHARDQGRFDSYPLRQSIFDCRISIFDFGAPIAPFCRSYLVATVRQRRIAVLR